MSRVICLILGGGRGTRLYPLTKSRSKPAVPIAGKYRLIDIPISNCIHSGLNEIFVLTQFNSVSLHRHIANTYKFDPFGGGMVEVLAAQQTMQHETWYQGTADAVRRNIPYFTENRYDLVLILSGDQLYRMDFQDMIRTHLENKAEVTIAALPVAEEEAKSCGIMRIDTSGRVTDFEEKPKTAEKLERIRTSPDWLERLGIQSQGRSYLASMGIYLFNRATLVQMLATGDATDFGKELFPQAIESHRVQSHLFDGYWEDIGTVGAFHKANIDLTSDNPPFDFTYGDHPIFTRPRYLPCSRLSGVTINNSLISDGCVIGRGSVIENSVIGVRAQIAENVTIRNTYIMGADSYEQTRHLEDNARANRPGVGVGADSIIENAIIDKNARIGRGVRIRNEAGVIDSDAAPHYVIRDKIVVIPKYTILQDRLVI
ncbi:glucose-1-phosphate adenylyltransferase [Singulisphaera acidiphila]|uniref:Glucose-1-phosphate adenylyltransferase n=1 Tax=Singulisphaera acidiphila (strain ATCC BAA-1392 / DSM 18658 / VKM B-2454 / MOB10) TaxID=886293 RepID=L0DB79_SINAD|nr:glucose-1-phosphate adenylyltransferase [Singulisphaera acidiphila]AGA25891.1 glucose-1-phosphate adenylyltransferase [Singulisphaera acidiphila DSM 18658]